MLRMEVLMKGMKLWRRTDAAQLTKWRKTHKVTKPLLGGRTPNRPRLADGQTVAVLAAILGLSVKEFAEVYDE